MKDKLTLMDNIKMNIKNDDAQFFCLSIALLILWCAAYFYYPSVMFFNNTTLAITEICYNNKTCAYDENGEYGADYIELFNNSEDPIDLLGYGLSDQKRNPYRFKFQDTTLIEPNETIVVWNSDDSDEVNSEYIREGYISKDIHGLGFGIKNGETIYLTDPSGKTVQTVPINEVDVGMVLASTLQNVTKLSASQSSIHFVSEKEEKGRNNISLSELSISIPGGWYEEDVFVSIFSPDGGVIYYTLDGSTPNSSSLVYQGEIKISDRSGEGNLYTKISDISLKNAYYPESPVDKGTVLKAIAIDKKGNTSPIISQTYFVGLESDGAYSGISIMEITIDPEDFFGYEKGIYVLGKVYQLYIDKYDVESMPNNYYIYSNANYAKEGRGWERPVHIEYYSSEHYKMMDQDVGIRIHGGWSVAYNQKSFNLYAREEYDGNYKFLYDFFGNEYNKIMLRAGGYRDLYATKLRDVFNQSLVTERTVGVQRAEPCAVFINGEYWGLYNLQETIGSSYISTHYGVASDNVIIMKNDDVNTSEKDRIYWDQVVDFATNQDLSIRDNYDCICSMIDIQSYIDYYCFQIYVANCDSISNNFARWRSSSISERPYEDGKWRWLLYDTDDSVGMVPSLTSYDIDSFISGHWSTDPLGDKADTLFSALMDNDMFKKQFVDTFYDMIENNFAYKDVNEKLNDIACKYELAVVKSQRRFRGLYVIGSYPEILSSEYESADFWREVEEIDNFYKNRAGYIIDYMIEDLNIE